MDPKRLLASRQLLAATWLVFVGVYGLLVYQYTNPGTWSDGRLFAWQVTSYLAEVLAVAVFVVAVGQLVLATPTVLGWVVAVLSLAYVPLHFVMSRGLFMGTDLYLQLASLRQPFYPVVTVLALVLLLRSGVIPNPVRKSSNPNP